MSAEEKAKELVTSFSFVEYNQNSGKKIFNKTLHDAAKQCALIAVEEVLQLAMSDQYKPQKHEVNYWGTVKEEIKKL